MHKQKRYKIVVRWSLQITLYMLCLDLAMCSGSTPEWAEGCIGMLHPCAAPLILTRILLPSDNDDARRVSMHLMHCCPSDQLPDASIHTRNDASCTVLMFHSNLTRRGAGNNSAGVRRQKEVSKNEESTGSIQGNSSSDAKSRCPGKMEISSNWLGI